MKKLHKIIAASLLVSASTMGTNVVLAESPLTANVGVTSNYMWRGVSQTSEGAAISGGIDYAHASGFYMGTWVSNQNWTSTTVANYEHDIYAGYGFDAGPVGLDIGYIKYMYPVGTGTDDFDEFYVNASFDMFSAGIALTTSKESGTLEDDTYIYVGAEFEVKKGLTLGITYGDYDFEAAGSDYSHMQVSLSKDDFTFAFDNADLAGDAGDPRFTVSWSHSIDL
jgi:uncharacterized protein (TIGR02001 family)